MIQACVASIKVDGRRDFDEQKWDLDFSDLAACTAAAKQHPKNVQVKGLLAFARLKGGVYERRAATAAVAELAAAAKAGDPFALYIYGRAQIDSLFMFADVKKNSIAGRAAIELAAKAGYPDAAYFLSRSTSGSRYSLETKNSLGAPDWRDRDAAEADVADARHWLEMAVRGGHAHAKAALAELLIKKDPSAAQEAHSPIIARAFALLDEALADQAISAADAARLLDEKTLKGDAQSQRPPLIAKITMALYDAMGKGGKERFDAAEALAEKILPVAVESRRAEIVGHLLNFFSQALAADEFAVLSERDFDKPSHHALFTLSNGLSKN
jgi:hypothetical protein